MSPPHIGICDILQSLLFIHVAFTCFFNFAQNAFEKNLRKELVTLTQQTKDPDEMDKAIERFDKLALEDKGDLKKAKSRRDFLKIRKGWYLYHLEDSMNKGKLEVQLSNGPTI